MALTQWVSWHVARERIFDPVLSFLVRRSPPRVARGVSGRSLGAIDVAGKREPASYEQRDHHGREPCGASGGTIAYRAATALRRCNFGRGLCWLSVLVERSVAWLWLDCYAGRARIDDRAGLRGHHRDRGVPALDARVSSRARRAAQQLAFYARSFVAEEREHIARLRRSGESHWRADSDPEAPEESILPPRGSAKR